ncbi:MAG: sensor histidine kinase [Eubacteriales bacterium]
MGKIVLGYIKYRLHILLFYAATAGITLAVQFLSNNVSEMAWYTVLLCGAVMVLFLIPDAFSFFKKSRELNRIADNLSRFEPDFPDAANLLEQEYTLIAQGLHRSFRDAKEELLFAHAQNLEYYTLWVHQIKTPIAAMQLVLQDMPETPEKNVLMQELFGIERYTDLALQYARLGSIASDLVIAQCELEPIVRECVKKYAVLFIYKKISVDIGDVSLSVLSDSKWLRFIIEQILSNAVKYTRTGGIRIYAENGNLMIEDSGSGIRPEDLPRIFEKGYTGFNGRSDSRASGIGLYLCKKVADALSVTLHAESALGRGTCFTLTFPNSDGFIFR